MKIKTMTIYRAIIRYNNADTCEWERWHYKCSPWYSKRELAEQHLDELKKFSHWLRCEYFKQYRDFLRCGKPYVEEATVNDEFVPFEIKLNENSVYNNSVTFIK